jgi:ribosomal protein RSM22 (predicted rRNA methylase)
MDLALPQSLTDRIGTSLVTLGFPTTKPRALAAAVQRLSDFYLAEPDGKTPWHESWAQAAYLAYFLPLNFVRVRRVLTQGKGVGFFDGLSRYTDFGAGTGTVSLALAETFGGQFTHGLCVERAGVAAKLHRQLQPEAVEQVTFAEKAPDRGERQGHLSIFSFSLTEVAELPRFARQSEALAIIEPATHQDGRRLLELRAELLQDGWHAWAPCTHQGACPLLAQSGRDWCHDRVGFAAPEWFRQMEEHLPMKNPTLAHAYLLLRRTPAPATLKGLARLTGDLRKEKGQSRQLVCRGEQREFLSWQKKHGDAPAWPRGELVEVAQDAEKKAQEIRVRDGQCRLVGRLP